MSEPLTMERRQAFLDHLAERSNVTLAAERAGVSRSAVYRLRATDPAFEQGWQDAIAAGYDELEFALLKRARFGVMKPFKRADGTLGRVTEYDDAHALKLLAAHRAGTAPRPRHDPARPSAVAAARNQMNETLDQMRTQLHTGTAASALAVGLQ